MLHKSTGILRHSRPDGYGYRLVLEIDPGIPLFYRSLIPKWFPTNGLRAKPHITLVRRETPKDKRAWGKYEGEKIEFFYDPNIQTDGQRYWWLNCYSTRMEEILLELGFPLTNYIEPKKGFRKVFHTTISNMKEIQMEERKRRRRDR